MDKTSPAIHEIIESICAEIPGGLPDQTVDTMKTGDPAQPVRGIVVTFMATLPVLERAAKLGANLVITHEPTFYGHRDETAWLEANDVYVSKRTYIDGNGIAVWRFHDGCHRLKPDGIVAGVIQKLGWEFTSQDGHGNVFTIEPRKAADLARWCKERLGISTVKIAGDPDLLCTRVGLLVGASGGQRQIQLFQKTGVDVVICGESPEWETCEYVRDATHIGKSKTLIVLGHANSEEAGMEWLAQWMRPLIPAHIPITYVQAGDPFLFV